MGRILFFLLLGLAAYFAWRWLRLAQRRGGEAARTPAGRGAASEAMVRCVTCGVHLPRSEAIASSGQYYCSEEHRRAPPAA